MTEDNIFHLLRITAENDSTDMLNWQTDLTFFADCSDVFSWGSADREEITDDNLHILERAFEDIRKTGSIHEHYAFWLFCVRVRKIRPQGAAYPKDKLLWPLFDAAGPKREVGFGNPYNPGEYDPLKWREA